MTPRIRPKYGETIAFLLSVVAEPSDECILWPFGRNGQGYGILRRGGKTVLAHRLALALYDKIDVPPPHIHTRHSCHTPLCINPQHMTWGTHAENMLDKAMACRSGGVKLTTDQVLQIRASIGTCKAVGEQFNVSASTVSLIRRRDMWAWL